MSGLNVAPGSTLQLDNGPGGASSILVTSLDYELSHDGPIQVTIHGVASAAIPLVGSPIPADHDTVVYEVESAVELLQQHRDIVGIAFEVFLWLPVLGGLLWWALT